MNHPMDRGAARLAVAAAIIIALIVGVAGYRWWTGEDRLIRSRLGGLADALSVPEGDGELARVARIAELRGYFAADVRIRFGGEEIMTRDALIALLGRWVPPPGGLTVDFVDTTVTFDEATDDRARVYLTATVTSRDARTGEELVDAREANVDVEKHNGGWVVTAVETADTLSRP